MLSVGTHTLSCRFYPTDIANYFSADCTTTVRVNKGVPVIEWLGEEVGHTLIYGTPLSLQLQYSGAVCVDKTVRGKWVYRPPVGAVLEVGRDIELQATFHADDTDTFLPISIQRLVTVLPFPVSLQWSLPQPPPLDPSQQQHQQHQSQPQQHQLHYGEVLTATELNASLSSSMGATAEEHAFHVRNLTGGVVVYTPPLGTMLAVGKKRMLSAVFTPPLAAYGNYCGKTSRVMLDVLKVTPNITWTLPKDPLLYLSPLSQDYLCARCKHPGVFQYSPPLHCILPLGRNTVTATFEPSDSSSVHSARVERCVLVVRGLPVVLWEGVPEEVEVGYRLTKKDLTAVLISPLHLTLEGEFVFNW